MPEIKKWWHEFYLDPFGKVDGLSLVVKGNNLNVFQKLGRMQKTCLWVAVTCLVLWFLLGFDSTPLQFMHVLYEGVPAYVAGQASVEDLVAIYHSFYGKEMHYSAFVIYGFMFYLVSRHLETRQAIRGSRNICYACSATFLAIALFEWFWIFSFGYFQNQPWVYTPRMPQLRIHMQNLMFTLCGGFGLLYLYVDSHIFSGDNTEILGRHYVLNWNWKAVALVALAVASGLVWWFYPGQVAPLTVDLETGGSWQNSQNFPQTLYTVDVDPTDDVNAGVWFYIENDLIHAWNTLVKILFSAAVLYVFRVRDE